MLDRKTKDIDASVELLEDRIKESKKYALGIYFIGTAIFIFAFLYYAITSLIVLPIYFAMLGLFVMYGFYYLNSYSDHLQTLLYLKRKEVNNEI